MLATLLQTPKSFSGHLQHSCKRRKVFRGTCSISANAKKFFEALAASLQTPKSFSGHLQHFCKRQKVFRSICSIAANTRKFFEALAASLQTPKSFSKHLQHFCKRQKVFRGTCSIPARPSPVPRRLMLSSNSRIEEAEAVCDGGYLWRRFQTMTDEKMDYGCDDRVCDGGKRTGV